MPGPAEEKFTWAKVREVLLNPDMLLSLGDASVLLFLQSPFVNACNQVVTVAGQNNKSSAASMKDIYKGLADKSLKTSVLNFGHGFQDHIAKEIPRIGSKALGLAFLHPHLKQHYPEYATLMFTIAMSSWEIVVNPFDVRKAKKYVGQPMQWNFKTVFAGAGVNVARQAVIWSGFSKSGQYLDAVLKQHTMIDPQSYYGILVKSLPIACSFTPFSLPLEQIKNRKQLKQKEHLSSFLNRNLTFREAALDIYRTQGVSGFFKGIAAKTAGNTVLAGCSLLLPKLTQDRKKNRGP